MRDICNETAPLQRAQYQCTSSAPHALPAIPLICANFAYLTNAKFLWQNSPLFVVVSFRFFAGARLGGWRFGCARCMCVCVCGVFSLLGNWPLPLPHCMSKSGHTSTLEDKVGFLFLFDCHFFLFFSIFYFFNFFCIIIFTSFCVFGIRRFFFFIFRFISLSATFDALNAPRSIVAYNLKVTYLQNKSFRGKFDNAKVTPFSCALIV